MGSGLEAMREILKINPKARVIFASADVGVEEDALNAGAVRFEKKPFPLKVLIENIESV